MLYIGSGSSCFDTRSDNLRLVVENVALRNLVSQYVSVLLSASFHQSSVRPHCTELNQATAQLTTNNHLIDGRSDADLYMLRTIMPETTWHMQIN